MPITINLNGDSLTTFPEQIRAALAENLARAIDLFRACDTDQSGEISRREFVQALSMCGLQDHKEDLKAVFDCFDLDGGGSIEYSELATIIRRSTAIAPQVKVRRRRGDAPSAVQSEVPITGTRSRPENAAPYTLVEIASPSWLPPGYAFPAWELIYEAFPGTNRGTGKVALVTVPSLKPPSILDEPIFSRQLGMVRRFPASVLRSNLVLRDLVAAGYSILAYEAHAPGATWADAGETTTAHLLAALEYVRSHRRLRYCSITLFAHGVGSTAAFAAMQRAPELFEYRVRTQILCEPEDDGGRLLLEGAVPACIVPTMLVARQPTSDDDQSAALWYAQSLQRAMRVTSELVLAPTGDVSALSAIHDPLDCLAFFAKQPGRLLDFLGVQSSGGARSEMSSPRGLLSPRGGVLTTINPWSPRMSVTSPRRLPPMRMRELSPLALRASPRK